MSELCHLENHLPVRANANEYIITGVCGGCENSYSDPNLINNLYGNKTTGVVSAQNYLSG